MSEDGASSFQSSLNAGVCLSVIRNNYRHCSTSIFKRILFTQHIKGQRKLTKYCTKTHTHQRLP